MSSSEMPQAWSDLVEALTLLAKGQIDHASPFSCTHDQLTVMADPEKFSPDELVQLDVWGFHADEESPTFYSFRYGSA